MSEQSLTGRTLGPFAVGRLLGKGGCGAVYRAQRTEDGPLVAADTVIALKVFYPDLVTDERTFRRFEREADLGQRIRHRHVVPTFECGAAELDGTTLHYMAMELVDGETLRETIAELGVVPEDLLYQIADQALDALSAVHAEGMVHRDVKPENLIITRDQQVRLMDLGVARLQQEGRDLTLDGEFVGSLAFAAPEQFTDQDHVDARSDIYALGVLLYEMATGVNPFDEPRLDLLLEKKLRGTVRRPRILNRDIDPFLDELIQTCLATDPDARFETCEALRAVLAERETSAWWQARIEGESFPASTRALRRLRPPREAPLVGRAGELEILHGRFEHVRGGTGATVFVTGPAGMGKSRLVHDFLEDLLAPDGPALLAGRCPEEGGRVHHPFLQAVRDYLGEEARASQRLEPLLGSGAEDAQALADAAWGRGAELATDDAARLLGRLLVALARERPVVLVLEDLQRADEGSVRLLERLAAALEASPLLIVGTWRPLEVEDGASLGAVATTLAARAENRSLALPPLDEDAIEALLGASLRTPRTVRALSWTLTRASSGNPHFLLEILGHMREAGVLRQEGDGWITTGPVRDVAVPESVRVLLLLRLVDVDPELMQLLEAAAAQGPEFDASVLGAVSGQKRLRLLKRLAVLERKHGILTSAGRGAFRFASHGLWQVIYEAMRPERRAACHAGCAEALRGEDASLAGERAFAWVRHMLAAGRLADALEEVPEAARYASTQVHAVQGIEFLVALARALDGEPAALACDVSLRLAALHDASGQNEAAAHVLDTARSAAAAAGAPALQARVALAEAEAALRAGEADLARERAEQAQALSETGGDAVGRARALAVLGGIAFRAGDYERSAATWREALALHEKVGDEAGAARIRLRLGRVLPELGEHDAARHALERALAGFRAAEDRRGEAAALHAVGRGHAAAGRAEEALACYEGALRLVRAVGDVAAEAATLLGMARLLASAARIEGARERFEAALDRFREIGDGTGEAATLDALGTMLAAVGEQAAAQDMLERAHTVARRTGDRAVMAGVLRHRAAVLHESGEGDSAQALFEEALEVAPPTERAATLAEAAHAALAAGRGEQAVGLLEAALGADPGEAVRLLCLARLARAHHEAGAEADARKAAEQAAALVGERDMAAAHHAPEIYYTLGTVLGQDPRGAEFLQRAGGLLDERKRAIRTVVHRDHYLTARWPNREILRELRAMR